MKKTLFTSLIFSICLFGNIGLQAQNGCTVSSAHNYDPNAVNDDGSCETCFDGVLNGDEEEIDCGGTNPACAKCPTKFSLDVQGNAKIDGVVGLGTTDPIKTLHIHTTPSSEQIRLSDNNGHWDIYGGNNLQFIDKDESTALHIDGSGLYQGNVGIGTTSPTEKLTVYGDTYLRPDDVQNSGLIFGAHLTRDYVSDPDFPQHRMKFVPLGGFNNFTRKALLGDESNYWDNGYIRNIRMGSSLGGSKLLLYNSGSSSYGMGVTAGQFKLHIGNPQAKFAFYDTPTESNEIFTINGNGTFGFNDPSPAHTLSVNGEVSKPGGGSWSNSSDRRLKTDIDDFKDGLKEILEIRPVWYRYNGKYGLPTEERYVGVIAQEVEKVAPYTVTPYIETDDKTGETGEYLSYNGTAVTYMLVNAVQEQHENLEKLAAEKDQEISILKKEIEDLKTLVSQLLDDKPKPLSEQNTLSEESNASIENLLFQNQPNPFTTETTITYNLPKITQNATIHITDLNGKILESYPINNIGKGSLTINGNTFAAGIYMYSLELDGQLVASKKMVLSK